MCLSNEVKWIPVPSQCYDVMMDLSQKTMHWSENKGNLSHDHYSHWKQRSWSLCPKMAATFFWCLVSCLFSYILWSSQRHIPKNIRISGRANPACSWILVRCEIMCSLCCMPDGELHSVLYCDSLLFCSVHLILMQLVKTNSSDMEFPRWMKFDFDSASTGSGKSL